MPSQMIGQTVMELQVEASLSMTFYRQVTSLFGEGNGTPLQYSSLENPMDGGAWYAAVHGVATSQI